MLKGGSTAQTANALNRDGVVFGTMLTLTHVWPHARRLNHRYLDVAVGEAVLLSGRDPK